MSKRDVVFRRILNKQNTMCMLDDMKMNAVVSHKDSSNHHLK